MSSSNQQRAILALVSIIAGLATTLFIVYKVFGDSFSGITEQASWRSILMINAFVGLSIVLFILELRRGALRVILTVVVAMFFGYLITLVFTFDTADRLMQGEFLVKVISEAEAVENDDVDLEYGRQRGGEFNRPILEPVTEVNYTFAGSAGDVVSILAFAADRRSEVDLQVALLGENGVQLAESLSATEEQVETTFEGDLQSEHDAVIADFTLPVDGIYTIYSRPEDITFGTRLSEASQQTQLAFEAFLLGPISRTNRWAAWVQDAITMILLGLAFAIVFRAKQFSLGAEGQLYFGALISGAIALNFSDVPRPILIPIILLAAATVGFLWGLIPGALKAYLGANELVSTLMLNVIATRFYEMVLTFQLKPPDAGYIATDKFETNAVLAPIVENTTVTIAIYILLFIVLATWLLIRRTPLGYEIRIIGSNLRFADYGGVNSKRTIMLVMAISGAVAGLAGAHLASGIHRSLIINISFGLAFEGVVVTLLARNNVLVVPFTGLLYAYLRVGAQFMERDADVSFEVVRVIQAIIILLITAEAIIGFFQNRQIRRRGNTPTNLTSDEQPLTFNASTSLTTGSGNV